MSLPDKALRIALASTLTLSGIKLIDPPYGDDIVIVGAVAAGVAAVVATVRWLVARRLVAESP